MNFSNLSYSCTSAADAASFRPKGVIVKTSEIPEQSNDEIWYATSNNQPVEFGDEWQNKPISNEYNPQIGMFIAKFAEDVTEIPGSAFDGYYYPSSLNLVDISLPDSVVSIGDGAFFGCANLKTVKTLSNISDIGNTVFAECTSLEAFITSNTIPPTLDTSFGEIFDSEILKIYVPAESVDTYKAADGWSDYADKIEAILN